jgi:hypothetical protein
VCPKIEMAGFETRFMRNVVWYKSEFLPDLLDDAPRRCSFR